MTLSAGPAHVDRLEFNYYNLKIHFPDYEKNASQKSIAHCDHPDNRMFVGNGTVCYPQPAECHGRSRHESAEKSVRIFLCFLRLRPQFTTTCQRTIQQCAPHF